MGEIMKKPTKATFKSFIRKNRQILQVLVKSSFSGMNDCINETGETEFKQVTNCSIKNSDENTLGISGLWLVGGGRDYFKPYYDDNMIGYEVSNCCGESIVAIPRILGA